MALQRYVVLDQYVEVGDDYPHPYVFGVGKVILTFECDAGDDLAVWDWLGRPGGGPVFTEIAVPIGARVGVDVQGEVCEVRTVLED